MKLLSYTKHRIHKVPTYIIMGINVKLNYIYILHHKRTYLN